jgi:hypothetical protein
MPPLLYVVTPITGLKKSERRAIAFLTCDGDPEIDAKTVFDDLSEKRTQELMTRFDYWIDGKTQDDYFHGFPNEPENKEVFTFKWKEKKVRQRFYGFLFRPKPKTNPGFQVCVLVSHTPKSQAETDPAHKKLANIMRLKQQVVNAIKAVFPDVKAGDESWQN